MVPNYQLLDSSNKDNRNYDGLLLLGHHFETYFKQLLTSKKVENNVDIIMEIFTSKAYLSKIYKAIKACCSLL